MPSQAHLLNITERGALDSWWKKTWGLMPEKGMCSLKFDVPDAGDWEDPHAANKRQRLDEVFLGILIVVCFVVHGLQVGIIILEEFVLFYTLLTHGPCSGWRVALALVHLQSITPAQLGRSSSHRSSVGAFG